MKKLPWGTTNAVEQYFKKLLHKFLIKEQNYASESRFAGNVTYGLNDYERT